MSEYLDQGVHNREHTRGRGMPLCFPAVVQPSWPTNADVRIVECRWRWRCETCWATGREQANRRRAAVGAARHSCDGAAVIATMFTWMCKRCGALGGMAISQRRAADAIERHIKHCLASAPLERRR